MLLRSRNNNKWSDAITQKLKETPKQNKPPIEPIVKIPYRQIDYDNDVKQLKTKIKKLKQELKLLKKRVLIENNSPYFVNPYYIGLDNFSKITNGLLDLSVELFWTKDKPIIYVFGMQKCLFEFEEQDIILNTSDFTIIGKLKIRNKRMVIELPDTCNLSYPIVLNSQHLIV